ncbi:MAG: hypothetical protein RIT81_34725, partial [Deltaproteobacteria bacterium]
NNPNVCSDSDGDSCDDCSGGSFDVAADGADFDADGLCEAGDPDIDNDGALNAADADDNDANVCSDTDADTCDDCSSGSFNVAADGADFDTDGLCDAGDPDIDNDGALNAADSDDNDANVCSHTDADTCDDCSSGSFNVAADGADFDADGLCDAGDPDIDNDGALNAADSDDNDANVCSDTDADTCDDCSSGSYDPANDGVDTDMNGICDAGEPAPSVANGSFESGDFTSWNAVGGLSAVYSGGGYLPQALEGTYYGYVRNSGGLSSLTMASGPTIDASRTYTFALGIGVAHTWSATYRLSVIARNGGDTILAQSNGGAFQGITGTVANHTNFIYESISVGPGVLAGHAGSELLLRIENNTPGEGLLVDHVVLNTSGLAPQPATYTFSFDETNSSDDLNGEVVFAFLQIAEVAGLSASDWLLIEIPGATGEHGGICSNNADWSIDKYVTYYGTGTQALLYSGDGIDPDGAGGAYTSGDSTSGYQVWAYRSTTANPWTSITIPPQGTRHYVEFGNAVGGWSPNYCMVPTTPAGSDICLGVRPNDGTWEAYMDGFNSNGTTMTISVGTNGAPRSHVCGF